MKIKRKDRNRIHKEYVEIFELLDLGFLPDLELEEEYVNIDEEKINEALWRIANNTMDWGRVARGQ